MEAPARADLALTRSSALRGATRMPRTPAWVRWRDRLPVGSARLRQRARRVSRRRASCCRRPTRGIARRATSPLTRRPAGVARARGAARLGVGRRARRDRAVPERDQQDAAGATGRRARCRGDRRDARPTRCYATLATEVHFYGVLAAEALGRARSSCAAEERPRDRRRPSARRRSARGREVRRVVKLAELDMRPESQREWAYVVRGLDDDALLQAADYARRDGPLRSRDQHRGAHRRAPRLRAALHDAVPHAIRPLRRATRRRRSAALRHRAAGVALRRRHRVVRRRDRPDAADAAAPRAGSRSSSRAATSSPRRSRRSTLNTQFGAYYFKYWQERLDGLPALAAAAYNAGPGRAQAWRPATPLEGAIWVETIPFNETRDYVKKVLANADDLHARAESPVRAARGAARHHRAEGRAVRAAARSRRRAE